MKEPMFSSFLKDDMTLYISKRKTEVVDSTLAADIRCLSGFDELLSSCSADSVNLDIVSKWIKGQERLRDNTVNRNIASLRGFLKYENAIRNKHYFVPEYRTHEDSYVPHFFSESETGSIYENIDSYKSGQNNILPWIKAELPMVVRILEGCGTRVSEILSLRMQDVDLINGVIIIKHAKLDKQRRVPMSAELSEILTKYCHAMGIAGNPDAFLFPRTSKEEHLILKDITWRRFVPTLRRLGIRNEKEYRRNERRPSLYNFRHTFAVNSFRQLSEQGVIHDDIV